MCLVPSRETMFADGAAPALILVKEALVSNVAQRHPAARWVRQRGQPYEGPPEGPPGGEPQPRCELQ